ncbi:MAG: 2-dehydropantoate 2-reductase [Alphaproteobacteria bacterium]|nr:2-dehydropantoate 2-reductase [Alphaproteobacteria bacterium]MDE2111913.1 2-dehydropantoate 2-reductase [Alphaproteobacteria bacterium]
MSQVLIVGPGAVGCAVGGALIEAGHNVTFCARQSFTRVSVTEVGGRSAVFPARVITSEKEAAPVDWVLLCVKAYQVPSAADWLRASVGRQTKVAVLLNGVEHRERVAPFVPEGVVLVPVVVELPVSRTAPGEVVWHRHARLAVSGGAAGKEFCGLFSGSFVTGETTDDFITRAWQKLCLNAPGGAILALTGLPMQVFHKAGIADVARAILKECIAVGRAEGAKLDDALIERQIAAFLKARPDEGNSMYADRMAGREMEWDARNGVIVRKGMQHGIPTPVSAALVPLLAALGPSTG